MSSNRNIFYILILFCVAFTVFSNTLDHGFVWDDHYFVEQNPKIREAAYIKDYFTKDTIGKQFVRVINFIFANIAEGKR